MRRRSRLLTRFLIFAGLSFATLAPLPAANAVEPGERLADATLEARARALSSGLRCLVCQNQSIDDSNAPLARDLRLLVRERLSAGDTDAAVNSFIVARYGDFVLLKPPFNLATLLLWLTPLLVLAFGILAFRRSFVVRNAAAHSRDDAPLTPDEQHRLDALLKKPDQNIPDRS